MTLSGERLVAQVEAQIKAEIATRNRTGIPEHRVGRDLGAARP